MNYNSDGSHAPTTVIKYNKGSVSAGTGGFVLEMQCKSEDEGICRVFSEQ